MKMYMYLILGYLAISFLVPTIVVRTNLLPRGVRGMAPLPFLILVRPGSPESTIVHEKVHIRQYKRLTWFGFYVKYFYYQFKYGYSENPMEVEAFRIQHSWEEKRK